MINCYIHEKIYRKASQSDPLFAHCFNKFRIKNTTSQNKRNVLKPRRQAILCYLAEWLAMLKPQFDSRTGHHQHLLTFGLTKPIVSFLFCSEKAVVRYCENLCAECIFMHPAFLFSESRMLRPSPPLLSPVRSGIDGNIHSKYSTSQKVTQY